MMRLWATLQTALECCVFRKELDGGERPPPPNHPPIVAILPSGIVWIRVHVQYHDCTRSQTSVATRFPSPTHEANRDI